MGGFKLSSRSANPYEAGVIDRLNNAGKRLGRRSGNQTLNNIKAKASQAGKRLFGKIRGRSSGVRSYYADTTAGAATPAGYDLSKERTTVNSKMGGSKRALASLSKDAANAASKRTLRMGLQQHARAAGSKVARDAAIKGQMRSISLRKTKRQDML